MTEKPSRPLSGPLRWFLRADAAMSSNLWLTVVFLMIFSLGFTGSLVGYISAAALFIAWVCVGIIGKRYESMNRGKDPSAGDGWHAIAKTLS
ncbi:hypothetical protein LUX01_04425 [Streptomyces sudanensis]|uniref:hypothetical protein n=1 Tax=Streptomyces sudanensis TaxID=436397 RepID=UPI0020CF4BC1|nr:hypothetical protein [Streptomyces sudanensis]MCP9986073.1 hypothetical protein [Streptomyces sudanensis]